MTQEEQRISIAKACGWEFRPASDGIPEWHRPDGSCCLNGLVPDYPQSLDAMHEAEKTLSDYETKEGGCQRDDYALELLKLVGLYKPDHWGGECQSDFFNVANATAAQRAEAFLKTIGKWTP